MTAEISTLQFQILSSSAKDVVNDTKERVYEITLFGATAEGYSVSLAVTDFQPFFYVELPDDHQIDWSPQEIRDYQEYLLDKLNDAERRDVTITTEKHRSFWDFSNNQLFTFLKVQARSKRLWTKLRNICQDSDTCLPTPVPRSVFRRGSTDDPLTMRVFEANIDPMLRFFHMREIRPAGWVTVSESFWEEVEEPTTTTAIQATASVDHVEPSLPAVQLSTAPLRIMAWDIECTSSHGDFPLAEKDWRKPAREIVAAGLKDWSAVSAAIQAATAGTGQLSRIYLRSTAIQSLLKRIEPMWSASLLVGDDAIDRVNDLLSRHLPPPVGDPIIQIGSVIYVNGKPVRKDIFVLGTCSKLPNQGASTFTHECDIESDLIRKWCQLIEEQDPDIMVGYNIFGFDNRYLWSRAKHLNCSDALRVLSRRMDAEVWDRHTRETNIVSPVQLKESFLSSSAMGDNTFYMFTAEGRLHIDLLAYVRRNAVLDSYSLDNVTATFMSGAVISVTPQDSKGLWTIRTKSTKGTIAGRYIVLMDDENDVIGDKLEVVAVEPKALIVRLLDGGAALKEHSLPASRWSQAKDDVSPKEIFALHAEGPSERAKVARYCIQDCDLVMELMQKLEVLNNSIAMANVCWVPAEFIFTRGQGIKSESLVFYECRKEGQLIPVLPAPPQSHEELDTEVAQDDTEGYEGAIVLDPLSGIYLDNEPVAALDFSSLYPSSIISENLSHDSVVWVKDYDLNGNLVAVKEGSDVYDNLDGWEYLEVDYDILKPDPVALRAGRKHPPLTVAGRRICRFAQPLDPKEKSTLPKILQKLLSQRKAARKLAEKETDEFRKALLDAQQLAYKLTANSLYGQLGSNTSKIRRKCIAASTTAHGRQQLLFSKACIEAAYGVDSAGKPVDPRCSAVVVYGDTDSVFISFRPLDPATGERLTGRAAQAAAKELAEEAGQKISGALKPPHDFEFDKMFRCFCLLSKKRYVGDMTEGGLEDSDYHRKSMGIVMKRRDNAPIVKYVYGGVIERILAQRDVVAAFEFARQAIRELLAGKFPMKRLTITKSLKAEYKLVPAHKILADRVGKRDPGNKPSSNDRIPFVYVLPPSGKPWPKAVSQGERIETPTYIKEQGLKPDYSFYITNQIAKPVAQVFGLVVAQLPGVKKHQVAKATTTAEKERLAEELLFGDLLLGAKGHQDLRSWFSPAK